MAADALESRWAWIASMGEPTATRTREFLRQIVESYDQMVDRIVVSAVPEDAGPSPGIGTEDCWTDRQGKIAQMLEKRGIVRSARYFRNGGPYGDGQEGFLVDADEATVREAHEHFEARYRALAAPPSAEGPASAGKSAGVMIHAGDHARIILGDQVTTVTLNSILERLIEVEADLTVPEPERAALKKQRERIETEVSSATPEPARVRHLLRGAGRMLEKITTAAGTTAAQAAIKHFLGQ